MLLIEFVIYLSIDLYNKFTNLLTTHDCCMWVMNADISDLQNFQRYARIMGG